ncbi:D-alanyl-D-alanine carboxypeptidase/D-alanyl-D-alanine endopeptidase [Hoyosella subflava]|uniref:Putative D-alanyl-D-alanine carboxypeptidase n=1 Tax=Hoyosella subflava (strain DSM 45089 / JCM 17490 / NBRC 109087 / DQS3-9A1) TaxID=443218 RepID=F6EIF1_HOYSD|nr:D-alanyl-D-alanine carboxypeptidase/D-alanyl-D-alanine-endopeptidase [Hoyosella subflava]AEF42443.1 Putative D-alanyl-D-alanine carboxypeptidase [Hoyosella subflava DQS3-9A1]
MCLRNRLGFIALISALVATSCTTTDDESPPASSDLPSDAVEIMSSDPYAAGRWSYLVLDPDDGRVIYSNLADEFFFLASISKEFTVSTVFDDLGSSTTLTTPVYSTVEPDDGTLTGDLILVASGDLALGGRGALEGQFRFTEGAVDHVYADVIPGAVLPEDDPLAGLDALAQQIADSGITEVDGDVLIDARLWEVLEAQEGPVPPIFVNDNLLDIEVNPGASGEPASLRMVPETGAFTLENSVETAEEGASANLEVSVDPENSRVLQVSGSIPPGDPALTVYRIPDAESWARTLFIEALERAGISVSTDALAANDATALPDASTYSDDREVASIESAPLGQMGGMILATSYNTGANAFLCLLATEAGSTDCDDGLPAIRELAESAGIDPSHVVLVDGQGGDPASATPEAVVQLLDYIQDQQWGDTFAEGLPNLGERGSLGITGQDSPARGKVRGKTGTKAEGVPATEQLFFSVQGLAGYLDIGNGKNVLFVVAVSNALFPSVDGIFQVNEDVAGVAAAFQQELEE